MQDRERSYVPQREKECGLAAVFQENSRRGEVSGAEFLGKFISSIVYLSSTSI